jgi:RNA polymerase sigma-70 factor (ECF subfamily)
VNLTDEEIMRRVQAGETDLFEWIFERHYARIERYLRHLGVPDRDREDLAAETFARAFARSRTFDVASGAQYLAYLYAIARNLAIDRSRSWARAPDIVPFEEERALVEQIPSPVGDPLDAVIRAEELRRIRTALDRLSATDREMIYLSYERQLSSKEIMAVMNKPSVTSVTTHLYKAMRKLREIVLADDARTGRAVYDTR